MDDDTDDAQPIMPSFERGLAVLNLQNGGSDASLQRYGSRQGAQEARGTGAGTGSGAQHRTVPINNAGFGRPSGARGGNLFDTVTIRRPALPSDPHQRFRTLNDLIETSQNLSNQAI